MKRILVVSSSPHLKSPDDIQSIMVDVLIALLPVALMAVFLFGYRALVTMIIAMFFAMATEAIILRNGKFFGDGSAAVTGLLLAMTLPPAPPWWVVAIGSIVAIADAVTARVGHIPRISRKVGFSFKIPLENS